MWPMQKHRPIQQRAKYLVHLFLFLFVCFNQPMAAFSIQELKTTNSQGGKSLSEYVWFEQMAGVLERV
jgi:hypothetical protein